MVKNLDNDSTSQGRDLVNTKFDSRTRREDVDY